MPVRMTYLGHAAWLIESQGYTLLIDPFLKGNPVAARQPDEVSPDFILISHAHGDHIGDALSIAKRTGATIISNNEIGNYFDAQGVKAHGMHLGGSHEFPFGRVKLTIAHHGSAFPDGSYGGNPCGFIINTGGKTIYDAADTALFYDMKLIGELEKPDVALLPIGDYYTMGPEDALYAADLIRPGLVIPMHYNTFDLLAQDEELFCDRCYREKGIPGRTLKPGESIELS